MAVFPFSKPPIELYIIVYTDDGRQRKAERTTVRCVLVMDRRIFGNIRISVEYPDFNKLCIFLLEKVSFFKINLKKMAAAIKLQNRD